jgi:MEKHLA domain
VNWPHLIADSYQRALGQRLCPADGLEDLSAVVLCHDAAEDPVLVFANRAARELWEAPLVGMPSRLTAPPEARAERAAALAAGSVVRGYSGERVAASGRRFQILDATVWPVWDDDGGVCGQAATFTHWRFLET